LAARDAAQLKLAVAQLSAETDRKVVSVTVNTREDDSVAAAVAKAVRPNRPVAPPHRICPERPRRISTRFGVLH
jgi:hypothetical protein